MRIVNSLSEPIRVRFWRDQNRNSVWHAAEIARIEPSAAAEIPLHKWRYADLKVGILPHADTRTYDSRYGGRLGPEADWPVTQGGLGLDVADDYVVTPNHRSRLVNWTKTRASLESGAAEAGAAGGANAAVQAGLQVGAGLIGALGTGIAALGPHGALPAGLILGAGSLLIMLIGGPASSGPPPLTEQQVNEIVTEVVRREIKKSEAETAATLFASSTAALLRHRRAVGQQLVNDAGQFNRQTLTDYEKIRFDTFLGTALNEGSTSSLHHHVHHLARDADRAKWVLPAFLTGVGTYLTLKAVDLLASNARSAPREEVIVSDDEAVEFRDLVDMLASALAEALSRFESLVDKRLADHGLQNTLKAEEVRSLVTRSILGVPSLEDIHTGIDGLRGIVAHIKQHPGGAVLSLVA